MHRANHFECRLVRVISCVALAVVAAIALPWRADAAGARPWMDLSLSPDARADLLVRAMTLAEKIQLVDGHFGAKLPFVPAPPGALGGDGFVPGIPRLAVPDLQVVGAGFGVTDLGERPNGQSTALPCALAETATWDLDLAAAEGGVVAREARAEGFNVLLGGAINLTREPRGGRTFEYHGEDPILAGHMVARELKAVQQEHVIADIKHFVVNDQETDRYGVSANIDERAMRESDLLAFEIGIKESGVGSVMCSYNRINGVYACENDLLLNKILKQEWRFPGWVMSDWGATHSTKEAALAGLDQEFFVGKYYGDALKAAVERGDVPAARLDDMVHRILRTMIAVGVIDHPPVIRPIDAKAGAAVAQRVAEAGTVLLKNGGDLLPIDPGRFKTIAVIGGHADVGVLSGGGSSQVNPIGGNAVSFTRNPSVPMDFLTQPTFDPSSPLKAIAAKAPTATIRFDPGTNPVQAAATAASADIAVLFVPEWRREGYDHASLALPDGQDQLVAAVAAANPHTVVVLETGGAVLTPWLGQVDAVLETWYPGQRGGEAIAEILFGAVVPSGKLPVTFPASDGDLPHPVVAGPPPGMNGEVNDFEMMMAPALVDVPYEEGLKVGYKWYDAEGKTPLFPFGFGLSYTRFSFSGLKIDGTAAVTVSFSVGNTGHRRGAEVAQIYAGLPADTGEPPRRLVAWRKLDLKPGETRIVTIVIPQKSLAIFDGVEHAWKVAEGDYHFFVGDSSRDLSLDATIHLDGGDLGL